MLLAARIIQYCLCSVSMVLTGLFAVSLTGVELSQVGNTDFTIELLLTLALFVLIGICIDLGKYLYWINRFRGTYYAGMSIILTVFSLIASCAFFVSAEYDAVEKITKSYVVSNATNTKIEAITKEISRLDKLVQNRLSSRYHDQWEEAENNTRRIRDLNVELALLQEKELENKAQYAHERVVVTRFFTSIGKILDIDAGLVRNIFYTVLALLLEMSALVSINLCYALPIEAEKKKSIIDREEDSFDEVKSVKKERLISDIKTGKISPVVRRIKSASYGLSLDDVRSILATLYNEGVLKKDKRNSYKLKSVFKKMII